MTNRIINTPKTSIMLVDGGKDYKVITLRGGDGKLAIHVYRKNDKLVWADHAEKYYYMGHTTELSQGQIKDLVGYRESANMHFAKEGTQATRLYHSPKEAFEGLLQLHL